MHFKVLELGKFPAVFGGREGALKALVPRKMTSLREMFPKVPCCRGSCKALSISAAFLNARPHWFCRVGPRPCAAIEQPHPRSGVQSRPPERCGDHALRAEQTFAAVRLLGAAGEARSAGAPRATSIFRGPLGAFPMYFGGDGPTS
eukprot:scaffold8172_cov248-Pinguiococcus_pyrenoidosus.AAC.6